MLAGRCLVESKPTINVKLRKETINSLIAMMNEKNAPDEMLNLSKAILDSLKQMQ